jgi:hypothetical protein
MMYQISKVDRGIDYILRSSTSGSHPQIQVDNDLASLNPKILRKNLGHK